MSRKPDILCVCETFCTDKHTDTFLTIAGYEIVSRRDGKDTANGIARGLLIYCKKGIIATELSIDGSNSVTECTGISLPWAHEGNSKVNIVLIYRPPREPDSPQDQGNTKRLCQVLKTLEGSVITVGDYNLPGIDWERGWSASTGEQMVIDTFNDMFWTQHVRGATHVGGNTLDLLTSSNLDMIVDLNNHGYLGTSDHIMLEASIAGPIRGVDSDELVPDWSKADLSSFKESVLSLCG